MVEISKVRIVGAGLIGTSLGLALKQLGYEIDFQDVNREAESLARDLVGGSLLTSPDLIVLATPVSAVFELLTTLYSSNPQAFFIDMTGIKSEVMQQVEEFPEIAARFCATHPMAGREFTGPTAAQSDLFTGRAWIVLPNSQTSEDLLGWLREMIRSLGATSYEMSADVHDQAIAAISQLPQVISSTLGLMLEELDIQALNLAGGGLRDVTRLAGSSGEIWSDLLHGNRAYLVPLLEEFQRNLAGFTASLNRQEDKEIKNYFERANRGRARISGKHGAQMRDYTYLPIVIDDRPGQLAALFDACAAVAVNVEDLAIEHSPGQETGLITLALSDSDANKLHRYLLDQGWGAHHPRK